MRKIQIVHLLILASIILTLYSWASGADLSFSAKGLKKNYFSLITAIFVHANIYHLLGNMLFLYVFGSVVEKELGGATLLFAFFLGGMLSFLLSMPFYPDSKMLGASAAIATLVAVTMLTEPLSFSILLLMPVGVAALLFFIYNIIAIAKGIGGNVAFVSHVIGFLIGVGLGIVWSKEWKKNLAITIFALIAYVIIINALYRWLLA